MKIIVLASQKGGAGKTTLCGHLSVQAALDGHKVALIDTDPQGSLAAWWNERESDSPAFISSSIIKLQNDIKLIKNEGFDYLFIDTPPAVTETIETVVAVADLVVIPTRPSPHDLRAVGKTVDIVNDCGKRMVFVINGAANRARISTDAAIALSPVSYTHLDVYKRQRMGSGKGGGSSGGKGSGGDKKDTTSKSDKSKQTTK